MALAGEEGRAVPWFFTADLEVIQVKSEVLSVWTMSRCEVWIIRWEGAGRTIGCRL